MKRSALDRFARDYNLEEPAIGAALDLTGARPDPRAWRVFTILLLRSLGVASLGAGVIFFVAANWQDYGLLGRFAILEAAFAAFIGLALWKPAPSLAGQGALILATVTAGATLALFGQSYQTGADVYELFFAWAALTIPLALAGRSGALWALWWVVLDIGLALYCGLLGESQFRWLWLDRWGIDRALSVLMPGILNIAGACVAVYAVRTPFSDHAPRWLARMLATIGFGFATIAGILAIVPGFGLQRSAGAQDAVVVLAFAIACGCIAAAVIRSRLDVYPMALIAGSWIAISTAFVIVHLGLRDIGLIFFVALWLIGTSTAAGFLLMRWVREWRVAEDA